MTLYKFPRWFDIALVGSFLLVSAVAVALSVEEPPRETETPERPHVRSASSPKAPVAMKKARADYFFRMLRDPAANAIPAQIRQHELAHARTLPTLRAGKGGALNLTWREAGPNDVGGRTRALSVDRSDTNVLLAGGASGGIWRSTNRGATWTLQSDPSLAVTDFAQDPRPGQTDTWYATTGEFQGSAHDRGRTAALYGSGLYKSVDGGMTWRLFVASLGNVTKFDAVMDYVSGVEVSPTTGTVFWASNGFGLSRLTDGGSSPTFVLGGPGEHEWTDVRVAPDGSLIAALSAGFVESTNPPGVYRSADDGQTWTDITPDDFPDFPSRTVVAIAASNPNVFYTFTWTGEGSGADEVSLLYRFDLAAGTAENRSANLPNFGGNVGHLDTQGAYNMALDVKPDDENLVLIGGTNLYRSRDGFASPATNLNDTWIGGYATANDISLYANQHPDQHATAFDPVDPNRFYSGHDGGVSVVDDITTAELDLPWQSLNNGYNVTQFYHLSLAAEAGDPRIMGGTQDNGSPFFLFDGATPSGSTDITTGDGSYSYIGEDLIFASYQNGQLLAYLSTDDPDPYKNILNSEEITPPGAQGQLFIHPFTVDPANEAVIYYPAGNTLWRSSIVNTATDDFELTREEMGWTELGAAALPDGFGYTTVAAAPNLLYLGASSDTEAPTVYRLDNAQTSMEAPEERPLPAGLEGAYVHNIAINPSDTDEIIVVLSNYNIVGLYHSLDGGQSYTAIEGNLEGDDDNPGPSLRAATLLPTTYVVGTSTGAYMTTHLDGGTTQWEQVAADELGNTVVAYVTSRPSDGTVALATHGRGIFLGSPEPVTSVAAPDDLPAGFVLEPNYPNPFNPSTTIRIQLPETADVKLGVYDMLGREVALLHEGTLAAGVHAMTFEADALPSGAYLYRLQTPTQTYTQTMILSK